MTDDTAAAPAAEARARRSPAERGHAAPALDRAFMARAVFVVALVAAVMLAVLLRSLFMLVFGAVIVAVLLRLIADPIDRRTPLNDKLSILAAVVIVLAVLGLAGWLFGYQVQQQVTELVGQLPGAWATLQERLRGNPLGGRILEAASQLQRQASGALALAPKIASGAAGVLTNLVLVVVAGVFLAVDPRGARDGVLKWIPDSAQDRGREVLDACGRALTQWLKGQLLSMLLVGSLTGVGLMLVGAPSPLALGLFAGLAQFVPIVGPIVSVVPGLLVSATGGTQQLLLVLVVYVAVQQAESNFITPMVQRRVASLPMVMGIFAVVAFGGLFGPLGIVFATPLAVVIYAVAGILYVRDTLGHEMEIPGVEAGKG